MNVQVQKEDDSILKRRKHNELQIKESDFAQYGADIMMFLRARDAKREAKMALKEAKATYD